MIKFFLENKFMVLSMILFFLFINPFSSFADPSWKIKEVRETSPGIESFSNFKRFVINTPGHETPSGRYSRKYQNKFLSILNSLPLNSTKNGISVGCDKFGKVWAVNSGEQRIVVDSDNGVVLFNENKKEDVSVSPCGRFVLFKDVEGTEEAPIIKTSILDLSSKNVLLKEEEDLDIASETFIGNDRWVWGYSNNTKQGYMVDLENPSVRLPMKRVDVPVGAIPMAGDHLLFGASNQSKCMAFFDLDSLKEKKQLQQVDLGIPFSNKDGSVIGTNGGLRVCFYNLDSNEDLGFGISQTNKNFLVVTKRQKIKTIGFDAKGNSDSNVAFYKEKDVIAKFIDLNSGKEIPFENAPEELKKGQHLRSTGKSASSNVANVFLDRSGEGFIVVFNRWNDPNHGDSIVVHFDKNLNIKDINHWGHVISPFSVFDEQDGSILSFDEKEKKYYKVIPTNDLN